MHSSRLVRLAVLLTATAGIARAALLPGPVGIPEFARQVAIDGDTAVVSASAEATELGSYVGAVYVFRRSGDAWVREARLTSIDPAANEYFGSSVAIDGNVIAVGVGRVVTPEVSGSVELFLLRQHPLHPAGRNRGSYLAHPIQHHRHQERHPAHREQ